MRQTIKLMTAPRVEQTLRGIEITLTLPREYRPEAERIAAEEAAAEKAALEAEKQAERERKAKASAKTTSNRSSSGSSRKKQSAI